MLRKIITENEAIMLQNYLEKEEIKKRFKIVPMHILKEVIEKGIDKGISISTIAESVGLAYISVYKLYEKMYKKGRVVVKDERKIEVGKNLVIECIKQMKSKSKIELAQILGNRIGRQINYSTINRILREGGIVL